MKIYPNNKKKGHTCPSFFISFFIITFFYYILYITFFRTNMINNNKNLEQKIFPMWNIPFPMWNILFPMWNNYSLCGI